MVAAATAVMAVAKAAGVVATDFNMLFVETVCTPSLPDPTYRITNLVGQTLVSGHVETRHATSLQIDVSSLPAGMYFINLDGQTVKFVKQ